MSFRHAPEPRPNRARRDQPIVTSFDLVEYVLGLVDGIEEPLGDIVVGIDGDGRPTGIAVRGGDPHLPPIDARQLVDIADELDAVEVFVATLVAGDTPLPRPGDAQAFGALDRACRELDLLVLDHVVVALGRTRPDGVPDLTFASLWEVLVHEVTTSEDEGR